MYFSVQDPRRMIWEQKYPAVIGGLLSLFEMILTVAILGCEIGGTLINFERMNAFVGYGGFPFFTLAWISLAGTSMILHSCMYIYLYFFIRLLL